VRFDIKGRSMPENPMSKLAHLLLILCISLFAGLALAGVKIADARWPEVAKQAKVIA
jgi:hypothetical protein